MTQAWFLFCGKVRSTLNLVYRLPRFLCLFKYQPTVLIIAPLLLFIVFCSSLVLSPHFPASFSPPDVAQVRDHSAGSSPPSPPHYGTRLSFYRVKIPATYLFPRQLASCLRPLLGALSSGFLWFCCIIPLPYVHCCTTATYRFILLCFFSELWLSFPVGLFRRFPLHFVCFIFCFIFIFVFICFLILFLFLFISYFSLPMYFCC